MSAVRYGGQSEVGTLRRVLLRHPRDAFHDDKRIDAQWRALGYLQPPDLGRAISEFESLVALLAEFGVTVELLPGADLGLDSIYVHDPAILTDRGAILGRMGKAQREPEASALGAYLVALGVPVRGAVGAPGTLEGGDFVWLDGATAAVGRGYRTNGEGIRQLRELLRGDVDELIEVPLPHWRGPDDVFHLMSVLSPVDERALLVYSALLPVPFRENLLDRGFTLIEIDASEFEDLACNVLALAPGVCLMLEGSPRTRERLEAAGIEVITFAGDEIARKGQGGPTCLTRPLLRDTNARDEGIVDVDAS